MACLPGAHVRRPRPSHHLGTGKLPRRRRTPQRSVVIDTTGLLLTVLVTTASVQDPTAARPSRPVPVVRAGTFPGCGSAGVDSVPRSLFM
ncbi:hypothetical protein EJC51_01780 [Streptomyces aquilus]|uniref:Transposase n=1 Tax=Streptomyces aquilus TaxID=2548456 RepID=A0A3Q9BVV6_9ACTN|nr:hypothetical protein EJC51_01780 [Streptomyces aquilus]